MSLLARLRPLSKSLPRSWRAFATRCGSLSRSATGSSMGRAQMDSPFEALQELLLSDAPDYAAFHMAARAAQEGLQGRELACARLVARAGLALQGFGERRAGTSDVAVLLRQVIQTFYRRLQMPQPLWQLLATRDEETG